MWFHLSALKRFKENIVNDIEQLNNLKSQLIKQQCEIERKKALCDQYLYERANDTVEKTVILVYDTIDHSDKALLHIGGRVFTKYGDSGIIIGFDRYNDDGESQEVIFVHNEDDERRESVGLSLLGW